MDYNFVKEQSSSLVNVLNDQVITDFLNKIEKNLPVIQKDYDKACKELFDFFDVGPESKKIAWQMAILNKKEDPYNISFLIERYKKNTLVAWLEAYGFSSQQIDSIYDLVIDTIYFKTIEQRLYFLRNLLNDFSRSSFKEKITKSYQLIQAISCKNLVDYYTQAPWAAFQFEQGILIRENQLHYLNLLLEDVNYVLQIIMGFGKSKLLVPGHVISHLKEDGLFMVEVPHALLGTNQKDLAVLVPGTNVVRLSFNRNQACSSQSFKQLYELLKFVADHKGAVITSAESIQSLDLKYVDLLKTYSTQEEQSEEIRNDQRESIRYLIEILKLFLNNTSVLIDEVDKEMRVNKDVIYSSGSTCSLNKKTYETVVELYSFFNNQSFWVNNKNISLSSILQNNAILSTEDEWKNLLSQLIRKLVSSSQSPLFVVKDKLRNIENIDNLFIGYLNNDSDDLLLKIEQLNLGENEKNRLAILKEEVNILLKLTLEKELSVHYGPYDPQNISMKHLLAIPYIASNVPNKRCQFSNVFEIINYTIQMTLISGIPKELLCYFIQEFQERANREFSKLIKEETIEDTDSWKIFKNLLGGRPDEFPALHEISLKNEKQIALLHKQLYKKPQIIKISINMVQQYKYMG